MEMSASCTLGTGNLNHNQNKSSRNNQEHIHHELTSSNIILNEVNYNTIESKFNEIFKEDVEEYNQKQVRKDRRIDSYYQKCLADKKITAPYRELIIQVGNRTDAQDPVKKEKMINTLTKFYNMWEDKYPQLKVVGAVIHVDEETPHLHLDFVPVANREKNGKGLRHKVSLDKALEQMGFEPEFSEINQKEKSKPIVFNGFRNNVMATIEEIANTEGIERKLMYNNKEHLSVKDYKEEQDTINKAKEELLKDNNFIEKMKNNKDVKNEVANIIVNNTPIDEQDRILNVELNKTKKLWEKSYKEKEDKAVEERIEKRVKEIEKNSNIIEEYKSRVRQEEKEKAIKEVAQMSDNEIIREQNKIITSLQFKIKDLKEIIKSVYENVSDTIKYLVTNKIFDKQEEIQNNFNNTSEEEKQMEIERNQELDRLLDDLEEEPEEEL